MSSVTAVPLRPVKRTYLIYFWIGLALALVSAFALARQGDDFLTRNARSSGVVTTASGLQYQVLEPGPQGGARPTDSDVTFINYEGRLLDGTVFDRSQQPTPMPVMGVIPGFSEGLKLMPKGSRYRFWLRPDLAYGEKGAGPIPPNSTLVFDVELLDFISAQALQQMRGPMPGIEAPGALPGR